MPASHLILKSLSVLVGLSSVSRWQHNLLWLITRGAKGEVVLVLSHLAETGLKINSKKFKLLSEQEVMLGHVENQDGILSHPGKVRITKEWPEPTNTSQLRALLGIAGHYRQFAPSCAEIPSPLYCAEQKSDKFQVDIKV